MRRASKFDRCTLAVVLFSFEGGGAQRDMILLCNALVAKGISVAMWVLRNHGPLQSLLDPAVKVVEIPSNRIRYAIFGIGQLLRANAPRLLLCSGAHLNLSSLAAVRLLPRSARPKLILREVESPSIAQDRNPHWKTRLSYRLLRHLYRYADKIITFTHGAQQDLKQNFSIPEEKISIMRSNAVIPPAVADRISRWDGESGRVPNLIVSIGRLSPEKGQRFLLEALTLMPAKCRWHLELVGDGPDRPALEAFVNDAGLAQRVTFTGHVMDSFAWIMRAKLVVCSSVYEGLGNAIIEALACGTPVVSTDCPYGPREILQDGRYGTLVPVGDARAMATAIEAALDKVVDRTELRARGLMHTTDRAAACFLAITAGL
jgi:glycosyltransferase involved in cell wall biosynthesis